MIDRVYCSALTGYLSINRTKADGRIWCLDGDFRGTFTLRFTNMVHRCIWMHSIRLSADQAQRLIYHWEELS